MRDAVLCKEVERCNTNQDVELNTYVLVLNTKIIAVNVSVKIMTIYFEPSL